MKISSIIVVLFSNVMTFAEMSQVVTCGSVIKLVSPTAKFRLHSHDVKYGSGSGQQSVTGTDVQEDVNSHWVVKGTSKYACSRGEPIACGSIVRLEHLTTRRNLHSHKFSSPLSGNQEVSAFGENGEGDTGDLWIVVCDTGFWQREQPIYLKHADTNKYLTASGQIYGRPIQGQMEICAMDQAAQRAQWQTAEGVYVLPTQQITKTMRDEL